MSASFWLRLQVMLVCREESSWLCSFQGTRSVCCSPGVGGKAIPEGRQQEKEKLCFSFSGGQWAGSVEKAHLHQGITLLLKQKQKKIVFYLGKQRHFENFS